VLVVDDDASMRRLVARVVERSGGTPVLCRSGQEALDWFAAGGRPRAVVLDLSMPGMDGVATLGRLRAAGYDGLAIICSSLDMPAVESDIAHLGEAACFSKVDDLSRLGEFLLARLSGGVKDSVLSPTAHS
jgi:CheY-like chemotaxis protein